MGTENKLKKFLVEYTRIPTNYSNTSCAIVEADNASDAVTLLKRQLGDLSSLSTYHYVAKEHKPEPVAGRVVSLDASNL